MRKKTILFLFTMLLIQALNPIVAQSDSTQIVTILNKIKSLEKIPDKRTEYISKIEHGILEMYTPQLYSIIKHEYDNLDKQSSKYIQFRISHLMECMYYIFGEYPKATKISYDMLKIANQTKDSLQFYCAYYSLSQLEEDLGDFKSGLDFLLLARKYASLNQGTLLDSYNDLACSYVYQNQFTKAKPFIDDAIQMAYKYKDYDQLIYAYSTKMDYYYKMDKLDSSLTCFQKIESIIEEKNYNEGQRILMNITLRASEIYIEKKAYQKAEELILKAFKMASESGDRRNLTSIYRKWSELEELKGNFVKSLDLFKQYTLLQDSIYSENSIIQLNGLKVVYELDKKEVEIEASKQKELFAKRQVWLISTLGIVFLAGLLILVLLLKSKLKGAILRENLIKEKSKVRKIEIENLEREVQLKNKELADLFLRQYEKAKFLNDLIESVDRSTVKLKEALDTHQNQQEEWVSFKAHFNKVHEGFFEKLNSLSPDFTSKDIRFCAYIRMNLSSKEIAIMLGMSHRTIEGIRGRVRKKLNLEPSEDVVLFLMNL